MLSGGVDFGAVFAKKKGKIKAKIRDQGLHRHGPYPMYIVNLGKVEKMSSKMADLPGTGEAQLDAWELLQSQKYPAKISHPDAVVLWPAPPVRSTSTRWRSW